jgi:hypothetical protein
MKGKVKVKGAPFYKAGIGFFWTVFGNGFCAVCGGF